jgi:hypothetical protein
MEFLKKSEGSSQWIMNSRSLATVVSHPIKMAAAMHVTEHLSFNACSSTGTCSYAAQKRCPQGSETTPQMRGADGLWASRGGSITFVPRTARRICIFERNLHNETHAVPRSWPPTAKPLDASKRGGSGCCSSGPVPPRQRQPCRFQRLQHSCVRL